MKEISVYNSYSEKKETLVPLKDGEVSIYVCGPTVYSSPHIGNFRPPIVFDTLRRFLISLGYKVTFVSNYTDVDDKIINEAKKEGISEKELTDRVIKEYQELSKAIGIMPPDVTPTPTEYMPKIISYIKDLVDKGYAYEADGDVYFRVRKVEGYGHLSHNSIESLEEGARIEVSSKKEDPLDFALWKKTEEGIKWDSPWGEGRPGWHSECCVMIDSIFREQNGYIDIHGGGFDLKFPHHENEIAQSIAHNGNGLAKYWIHNGFINIGSEKMSKSLGNVTLMKDVVSAYGGPAFRLNILSTHYRAPVSYSADSMEDSKKKYLQIVSALKKAAVELTMMDIDPYEGGFAEISAFEDALADDLNTPNALSVVYEETKKLNGLLRARPLDASALGETFRSLSHHLDILGLGLEKIVINPHDKELLEEYRKAREAKDFAKSDALRPALLEKGYL